MLAVGSGAGASDDEALAAARNAAIDRLAVAMLAELAGSELHHVITARLGGVPASESRPDVVSAEASRYLRQVGSIATPERVDAVVDRGPAKVSVVARYRLRKDEFDAAVAAYRKTTSAFGFTVAPAFPLLARARIAGQDLVVVAVDAAGPAAAAGLRQGEEIVAINGRAVPGIEAFAAAATAASKGAIELQIEGDGARRTIKIDRR